MDGNESQYGSLTPDSDNNQEKKKDDKKKKVVIGFAVLALLGASAVCIGSGILDRPQPIPEEEVAVRVTPTKRAQQPQSTPAEVVQEPVDVLEGWLGNYEGTGTGRRRSEYEGTTYVTEIEPNVDFLWMEIQPQEYCWFCDEERTWGLDLWFGGCDNGLDLMGIRLLLPDDLNDAPGLTVTEDRITFTPTKENPYEGVVEMEDGQLEGHLVTDWEIDGEGSIQWTVDYFTVNLTAETPPCMR